MQIAKLKIARGAAEHAAKLVAEAVSEHPKPDTYSDCGCPICDCAKITAKVPRRIDAALEFAIMIAREVESEVGE